MDANILAGWQLVATIILGLLTIATYFLIAKLSTTNNKFNRLDDELNNIVNTWVKYPYLEDDDFIGAYHTNQADKMAAYNEYTEMIVVHRRWWAKNQSDELTAYTGAFKTFVQSAVNNYKPGESQ